MIIGITGTNGAGKGTVVKILSEKGFAHYSARKFIIEELERRGLPIDRDAMIALGNEMRREHGPAYIAEQLFKRAQAKGGDAIIESVRAVKEAEFLKAHGAVLLFVDAEIRARYERAALRGSSTDHVDFDTFVAQEQREMASTEAWNMSIGGVAKMADFTIMNDGTIDELHEKVDELLQTLSTAAH